MNTFDQGPYNNFVPDPTQKKNSIIFYCIAGALIIIGSSLFLVSKIKIKQIDNSQKDN